MITGVEGGPRVIAGPCHKKKHPPQLLPDHRLTIVSRDEKRVLGVIFEKRKKEFSILYSIVPSATVTIRRHNRQMRPNRIEHLDNKKGSDDDDAAAAAL